VTQAGNTISHAYAYAGTYYPYVTVTQDNGTVGATSANLPITTTGSVTVTPGSLTAGLRYSFPGDNVAPVEVDFDTSGTAGDISSYTLDFGDGGSTPDVLSNTGTPALMIPHTYQAPGTYTATLTVTDSSGNTASQSQSFTLVPVQQLTAELALSTSGGLAPLAVTLDGCHSVAGNGGSITSYAIDFDDGSPIVTQLVDATHLVNCSAADRRLDPSRFVHVYAARPAPYLPTLTVTDDASNRASAKSLKGITVERAPVPKPAAIAGGGGALGLFTLLPLVIGALGRRKRSSAC